MGRQSAAVSRWAGKGSRLRRRWAKVRTVSEGAVTQWTAIRGIECTFILVSDGAGCVERNQHFSTKTGEFFNIIKEQTDSICPIWSLTSIMIIKG